MLHTISVHILLIVAWNNNNCQIYSERNSICNQDSYNIRQLLAGMKEIGLKNQHVALVRDYGEHWCLPGMHLVDSQVNLIFRYGSKRFIVSFCKPSRWYRAYT